MPHAEEPPISQLHVNDGPLEPENVARLRPTSLDTPIDEIRRRYAEDGYVFLKGLIPREDVLKARENYFTHVESTGVLAPGSQAVEGKFNAHKDKANYPGIGSGWDKNDGGDCYEASVAQKFVDLAVQAHGEPWYVDFCRHPALKSFIAAMTGWGEKTMGVKRTLLRNNTPGNKAIGVHYDQIFLRYGEDNSVTAWVPVGNVNVNGGGLIYLENGHTLGSELEQSFTHKAKEAGMNDAEVRNAFNANMVSGGMLSHSPAKFGKEHNRRWLVADYEAGDVVLHTAFTIHASTINYDPNNIIRLGTDLRFVDETSEWDRRWSNVYRLDDGI